MADKEIRVLQLQPEIRAGADGKKMITGYAVKWRSLSLPIWGVWREQFEKDAFTQSLTERANEIFATWQHDMGQTLGRSPATLTVREDDTGLSYEIDPPSWAAPQIETIERGDVRGSSFTFIPLVEEWDYDSAPNYAIRTIKKADLFEVAPVTMPAYPTSVAGVRSESDVAEMVAREKQKRKQQISGYLERQKTLRDISIRS